MLKFKNELKLGLREKLIILCPAVVLATLAFLIAFNFVDPFPPRRLSIGCGPPQGANFNFAQAYQEILAKEGITLDLRTTAGSAENLKLLGAASGGVDVAFVQGSMKSLAPNTDLVSLGSLFFEPLWIFYRNDLALRRIPDLKGLRLAVGKEGSGTKILTIHLLKLNGVDSQNTRILTYGYQKAAEMLLNAEVDVAFFVSVGLPDGAPPYAKLFYCCRLATRFSTTEGSANVLVSPSEPSSFSAILRKMRRIILPERVFGNPGAH